MSTSRELNRVFKEMEAMEKKVVAAAKKCVPTPDGILTIREAAKMLGVSQKGTEELVEGSEELELIVAFSYGNYIGPDLKPGDRGIEYVGE